MHRLFPFPFLFLSFFIFGRCYKILHDPGHGFQYILSSLNAERVLIASEAIGDAHFFLDRACDYAKQRRVFDRPIGQNQGIQFPLAKAYANVEAAALTVQAAAALFQAGKECGTAANTGFQIADATDLAALFNKGYASIAGARDDGTTGTGSFHYYGYTLEQVSQTQVRLAFQRINYNCATYCSYCSYCNYCSASNCNCDCCDG